MSAAWRKSSYSGNGGQDCVETASSDGSIMIRDTKDRERGPVLCVDPEAWRAFTDSVR